MNISAISSLMPTAKLGAPSDLPASTPASPAAADRKKVAQQFEAILVRQLLGKTMSSMLSSGDHSTAGTVYGDMITDSLAQQLTAGPGLGLGRMIEKQLTPRGTPLTGPDAKPSPSS